MKLQFLGTGGGRYVTGEQKRRTAGILVETDETKLLVDPGPGALVYVNSELDDPGEIEAVIVSHGHLDHSNDAQAIIEMMTDAYNNAGALFASESVLSGYGEIEKEVSEYHKKKLARVEQLEEGESFEFRDLEIESQEMFHRDPKTQGFKLYDGDRKIGFWTDTEFSEELLDFYKDVDTLVVFCGRPKGEGVSGHTSLDSVPEIVNEASPGTVIITHFGYKFLESGMEEQEEWLEEQVDAKVVFADDGMKFPGDAKLSRFA